MLYDSKLYLWLFRYTIYKLEASLIMVFIVLQFARCSIDGCMPLFAFLIMQFCSHVVISYCVYTLQAN